MLKSNFVQSEEHLITQEIRLNSVPLLSSLATTTNNNNNNFNDEKEEEEGVEKEDFEIDFGEWNHLKDMTVIDTPGLRFLVFSIWVVCHSFLSLEIHGHFFILFPIFHDHFIF